MEYERANLKDMLPEEIARLSEDMGEQKYRGKQIFKWIYRNVESIDQMSDLPLKFREALKSKAYIGRVLIAKKLVSSNDKTVKYLLRLEDGNVVESVLMEYSFGLSACISTQVGCRMGCSFCASTIGGMVRSLTAGEMVDEVMAMERDSKCRISNIVLMGSGEPLDNFDNVIKFLKIINHNDGLNIGMRHITISTCGLVPEIIRLSKLNLQITLAISLHAPNDEIRKEIMPVANRYSINEVMNACSEYIKTTNKRITFEYSLIRGLNDSTDCARQLSVLLKGMLCNVNLIPINEIKEREYRKSSREIIDNFKKILSLNGIEATVRRELGADINAACGQLRKNYLDYSKMQE